MKILFVNSVCGIGSTGRIVTDLYDSAIEVDDNIECCIAYGRGNAPKEYNTYKIGGKLSKLNNYIHLAETRLFDNHGFSSRIATKRLVKFIQKYDPDVIHLHNLHGYYINIPILMGCLEELKCKVVWTLHDTWLFSGHTATLDINSNGVVKHVDYHIEKKQYPKSISFFDNRIRNLERKKQSISILNNLIIVTPSHWLKKALKNSYLSSFETMVIYNGIDLNVFNSQVIKKNRPDNKIKVLGIANIWVPTKGLSFFNKLAMDERFAISIIGDTDDQFVDKNIHKIGSVSSTEELAGYYSKHDVFFNPTTRDNFPTTNIEALACGTPVATFNTGGSSESINDKTGVVVNNQSVSGISEGISNAAKLNSKDCIERALLFSKNKMFETYFEIYK